MGQALCNVKGCKVFLAIIPLNNDGTCNWQQPKYLKSTTTWDLKVSSSDSEDGETVDNTNGCTTGTSSCSAELSWNAQLCNKSNTGQNDLVCDSNVLIAGFYHDGKVFDDNFEVVPAEANLLFGGYAQIGDWNLSNPGKNEIMTVSSTFKMPAGKYNYGVIRNEENKLTFNELCEMAA